MPTYNNYEYIISECEVQIISSPQALEPSYKIGYTYEILSVYASGCSEESSEWYDTYQEAENACHERIERFCDGPREPDYDTPNYFEQSPEWWEERRKLGE